MEKVARTESLQEIIAEMRETTKTDGRAAQIGREHHCREIRRIVRLELPDPLLKVDSGTDQNEQQ